MKKNKRSGKGGFIPILKTRIARRMRFIFLKDAFVFGFFPQFVCKEKKTMRVSNAGFTLVETFVAISILLLALVGPLTIASKGLISSTIAKDQTTAFYLAQDAVEYIRNTRDRNNLNQNPWLTDLGACAAGTCTVDSSNRRPPAEVVKSCSGGACQPLRRSENSGLYGYNASWSETIFTRTVSLTQISDNETAVAVTISWRAKGLSSQKSFTIKEHILNWQ